MSLMLVWTVLTAALWTSGSPQTFGSEPVKTLYPQINASEIMDCDCTPPYCEQVTWFRTLHPPLQPNPDPKPNPNPVQFIGWANQAERTNYRPEAGDKFQITKRGASGYSLRVANVSVEDRGVYVCVLKDRKIGELWRSGVLLLPGESPPTEAPEKKTTTPSKPKCRCTKYKDTAEGCSPVVQWSLVGLISALSLTLLCTLYYYSRLPKKCRHRFVKKK